MHDVCVMGVPKKTRWAQIHPVTVTVISKVNM